MRSTPASFCEFKGGVCIGTCGLMERTCAASVVFGAVPGGKTVPAFSILVIPLEMALAVATCRGSDADIFCCSILIQFISTVGFTAMSFNREGGNETAGGALICAAELL